MSMFILRGVLSLLLFFGSVIIGLKYNKDKEKLSIFECGFNPFLKLRVPFSIHFFKILLIFLLFDLEIVVILPIPLRNKIREEILFYIRLIILILIFGLFYEWKEGGLEWLKN